MHTKGFVLIPKPMYAREKFHVSQLISNKIIKNPAKHISLRQRNKLPTAPPTCQIDTEQQIGASMDDTSTINKSMEKPFMTDNTITIRKEVLIDIRVLKGIKFETARKILEILEKSDSVTLDSSKRLLLNGTNTEVLAATILYNLQHTTCKLSLKHFIVLRHLDIGPHLTCNAYAKKFLNLSSEAKPQFLECESDKQVASRSRREKAKASNNHEGSFEEAEEERKPTSLWKHYFLSS